MIGRESESKLIAAAIHAGRNVLLEGPVGVGKTYLVNELFQKLKLRAFRVDGDHRFSEQKLTGWFDPPQVISAGYTRETFIPGPLVEAMETGCALFINELNRLPESVQNVLLPAIDERRLILPRLGEVVAKPGFFVIATQNPAEFVATTHLSEALMDRFELIRLDYQSEDEEVEMLISAFPKAPVSSSVARRCVRLCRLSRSHEGIRRGASVRAALSLAALVSAGVEFSQAAQMALTTRIDLSDHQRKISEVIEELLGLLDGASSTSKKKT